MSAFGDLIKRGTRALQPAATAVAVGTVYCVTDESRIQERSNGTTWDSFCPAVAAGPAWVAVTNAAASGANVDFTGLSAYNEILVFIKQVTGTGACIRQLLVSTDSVNYKNASGDYINFDSNGAESNGTVLSFTNGNNANAQSGYIMISNFNSASIKWVTSGFPTTNLCGYIPTTVGALQAVRVRPHANSFNGGTIYIFGR